MKSIILRVLYVTIFAGTLFPFIFLVNFSHADVLNKVIASVAGEIITQYDVFLAMQAQLKSENIDIKNVRNRERIERMQETVLNDLINDILIMQEAKKYGVVISSRDVDNEMRKIARENNISLTTLEKQIALQGNDVEKFRENLKNNLMRQQMIGSFVWRKIVITSQEIEEAYKKESERYKTDSIFSLLHLVFDSKERADEVLKNIKSKKTTFNSLVKDESEANLGEFVFSELAPSWQRVLFSAKKGDTVGPLAVDRNYFLLFILKKEEGKALPLDEVYTTIENSLREARFAKQYAFFTDSLRKKTNIIIYK